MADTTNAQQAQGERAEARVWLSPSKRAAARRRTLAEAIRSERDGERDGDRS